MNFNLLADQNADKSAEVIKVEHPSGGDFTRSAANRQGNVSASFLIKIMREIILSEDW
jgi:crotonobetainyl-CoA:carnitine CoA-transferase CaiB-like acyl-CoA transferase